MCAGHDCASQLMSTMAKYIPVLSLVRTMFFFLVLIFVAHTKRSRRDFCRATHECKVYEERCLQPSSTLIMTYVRHFYLPHIVVGLSW